MKNRIQLYNYLYYTLVGIGIIFFLYVILHNYSTYAIWESFPDSSDYKVQSELSLLSFDFYAPKTSIVYAPRPFTVPLVYKLASSDPYKMILLQKIIYCISVICLIFSVLKYILNKYVKLISLYLLLYYFTWWNIVGWSGNILSESLSMSFLFLWFSIILFYYKKPTYSILILLIASSILLSFTRDTWPYIILIFSVINLITFKFQKNILFKHNIIFFIFSIFLFLFQNYTSSIGDRYKLPVFNSIAGRISQNDEYLLWFKNEGMPLSEQLKKDFKNIDVDKEENKYIFYEKYNNPNYTPLFDWILKDGKLVYQKFILTHPSYFLLKDQNFKQIDRIFCSNLFGYTQKPKAFFVNADKIFPYFNLTANFILLILIAIITFISKRIIFFFPLLLNILFIINALICYNADTLEVRRHLFITQIILEFVCILSIILLLDNIKLFKYFLNKIKWKSNVE